MTTTTQPIQCQHCSRIFFDFPAFNDHIATEHRTAAAMSEALSHEGPLTCIGCGRVFDNPRLSTAKQSLRNHWSKYPEHRGQAAVSQAPIPPAGDAPAPANAVPDPDGDYREPRSRLDETILRDPSLPDDLAALGARVAQLEEELYRLGQQYNVHSRAKDAHENPGSRLGVN